MQKKFYHWEIKGVPLRIEIGMRDIKQNRITIFRRDRLSRQQILKLNIGLVSELLTQIQKDMYTKAKLEIEKYITKVTNFDQFLDELNNGKLILAPWCGTKSCEEDVGIKSKEKEGGTNARKAKSLCIPFDQNAHNEKHCFNCSNTENIKWTYFSRSY